MIKPAIPELAIEKWTLRANLFQNCKTFLGLPRGAAEVNTYRKIGKRTSRDMFWSVHREELRFSEPCIDEHGTNCFHVVMIVAKRTVLVLHLHEQDWAAVSDLQIS